MPHSFCRPPTHSLPLSATLFVLSTVWLCLTVSPVAQSRAVDSDNDPLRDQRMHYREARQLLREKRYEDYKKLRESLVDYALFGQLEYRYWLAHKSQINQQVLDTFEQTHKNPRLSRSLHRRWLEQLAKKKRWQTFLDAYREQSASTALRCSHALALYRQGDTEEAFSLTRDLWLSPSSQPKSCDSLFHIFTDAGKVTGELGWQRFLLAFTQRELQLADYLTRFLDRDKHRVAELALMLYRRPEHIDERWAQLPTDESLAPLKLTLLKRYARKDLKSAHAFVVSKLDSDTVNASFDENIKPYLLTRQALRDYRNVPAMYGDLQKPTDTTSLQWLLRAQLVQGRWQQALGIAEQLHALDSDQMAWRYWQYRCKELLGALNDSETLAYQALADKRNFYSFMTAWRQGHAYVFEHVKGEAANETFVQQHPGLLRAFEHFFQEETLEARREWHQATRNFSSDQHRQAARIARKFGWYNQAIGAAITAQAWNELELRFPDVYAETYRFQALKHRFPEAWLYATGRQESAFAPDAYSSAGAMGLMQLLPSTAKQVAHRAGLEYRRDWLYNAGYNIRLAAHYLSGLYQRFDENRVLASAAYNAGPHRVKQWLAQVEKPIPIDAFIESIPFAETRQYAQNILSFSLIHEVLNGDDSSDAVPPSFLHPQEVMVYPLTTSAQPAAK